MKVTFLNNKTRTVMIIVSLLLAYLVGSWAVDSGSLVVYGLGFVLFLAGVCNVAILVRQQFIQSTTHKSKRS